MLLWSISLHWLSIFLSQNFDYFLTFPQTHFPLHHLRMFMKIRFCSHITTKKKFEASSRCNQEFFLPKLSLSLNEFRITILRREGTLELNWNLFLNNNIKKRGLKGTWHVQFDDSKDENIKKWKTSKKLKIQIRIFFLLFFHGWCWFLALSQEKNISYGTFYEILHLIHVKGFQWKIMSWNILKKPLLPARDAGPETLG